MWASLCVRVRTAHRTPGTWDLGHRQFMYVRATGYYYYNAPRTDCGATGGGGLDTRYIADIRQIEARERLGGGITHIKSATAFALS